MKKKVVRQYETRKDAIKAKTSFVSYVLDQFDQRGLNYNGEDGVFVSVNKNNELCVDTGYVRMFEAWGS